MRRGVLLGAALGVINTGVVVALDWALRRRGDFGWYSYSPMPGRYADYLPARHVVSGLVAAAVVAGALVAVNALAVVGFLVLRGGTTGG